MKFRTSLFTGFLASLLLVFLVAGCADREEASRELVKKGKKKLSIGRIEEATGYFEEAIGKDRKNFEAWHFLGSCKISKGEFEQSLDDFSKAIELNPGYSPAWYNRGLAYFYLEDQGKACEDWKKAEELGHLNISDKTRHCP